MDTLYCFAEIKRAKYGNEQSALNLINHFNPILRKYAHLLSYADAYADLRCEFLALIKVFPTENHFENDGAVVNYIQKSIINAYTRINKKRKADRSVTFYNELSDEQVEAVENGTGTVDDYSGIFVEDLRKLLTITEFKVLYRYYILRFTIAEIAAQDNIARQTVNRTKKRAIGKLKALYDCIE